MVCLSYLNLLFAKKSLVAACWAITLFLVSPKASVGVCLHVTGMITGPRCSSLFPSSLIHGLQPCSACSLVEGFCFWCWEFFACLFSFKFCTKIRNWSNSKVHDCSRAGNNPALQEWTSYLGQWFLRRSAGCHNRWALLRALGSMMFFFKQKWLYKYSAKRPLTLKYILSAIKYTVFVPQYQVGCSRKQ